MTMIRLFLLTLVSLSTLPLGAERAFDLIEPTPCPSALAVDTERPEKFLDHSVADLVRTITYGLDRKILTARDLARHYRAGSRGTNLKTFVTYITKRLGDAAEVGAIGRVTTPAEVRYQTELTRIRKEALAFGERNPAWHPRLTKEWQTTVKALSRHALGLKPRASLNDAIEDSAIQ